MNQKETTEVAVVILPEEVQTLALRVSDEKREEVTNTLSQIFAGTADWKNQVEAIVVNDPFDKMGMNLAKTARLNAKNARLAAEKLIDQKRDEVQVQMLSFQTEDKLWLKAKQTMQILFKEIETMAEYKEKTAERHEAEQLELRTQTRLAKVVTVNPEITRTEIEFMSEASFEVFYNGLVASKKQKEEEAAAELKKQEEVKLRKQRDDDRFKVFAGTGLIFTNGVFANAEVKYDLSELCELDNETFALKVQEATDKVAECKAAEIKEQERLRIIAKQKEKELAEEKEKAEQERKKQEDIRKKETEEKNTRFEARKNIMIGLGFEYFEDAEYNFSLKGVWSCFYEQIYNPSDKEFEAYISDIKNAIVRNAEKAKQDEVIAKQKAEARQLEIEAAKKQAELEAELAARKKQEAEAKAAEQAEIAAQEKARQAALLAPRKEKLTTWIDGLSLNAPAGCEEDVLVGDILIKFSGFKKWAKSEVEKL